MSEHGIPLVYFSTKRENVLVYLSNAVEKYCKETGFHHTGRYFKKWGPYGFDQNGRQQIEEYYPNAVYDTYKSVSGYIYCVDTIEKAPIEISIPDAAVTDREVRVSHCEYVPDAYEAILHAEKMGLISIVRYDELIARRRAWLEKCIQEEYAVSADHLEYRHFLLGKFGDILRNIPQ